MTQKRINVKTKQKFVQRYQLGEPAEGLCKEPGVAKSTFYYWAKTHQMQITE